MRAAVKLALILIVLVAACVVLIGQLELEHRLDAFLPAPATAEQALITDQLGAGPGSRTIFASVGGASPEQLAQASRALAERWRALPEIEQVENGEWAPDSETLDRLMAYRFVLVDDVRPRLEPEQIRESLEDRLSELALGGSRAERLIRRDPLGLLVDLGNRLGQDRGQETFDDLWFDKDHERALLVVTTSVPAFDTENQARLLDQLHESLDTVGERRNLQMSLAGTPVISADAAQTARNNAVWLSSIGTVFLVVVLLAAWRSPLLVLAGAVPLAAAATGALAVLTLGFDAVHGLTLAFGLTLLGVALDYPVHLFGHTGGIRMSAAARIIRRPVLLGAFSTVIAYIAIWHSPSPGLAQIGAASAAGLLTAAAVTLLVLPRTSLPEPGGPRSLPQRLPSWPWLPVAATAVALVVLLALGEGRWSHDLSRLSPADSELIAEDIELRTQLGGGEARYLLALGGEELESVLQATERSVRLLEQARQAGLIGSWCSVTDLVPSQATQDQRRQAWSGAEALRERLSRAAVRFRSDAFEPFLDDLEGLSTRSPVTADTWQGTRLQNSVDTLLARHDKGWRSLIVPIDLDQPEALAGWLDDHDSPARLVDLKQVVETMLAGYRRDVLASLTVAALLIIALLWLRLGQGLLVARVLMPPLAAVSCTAAVMSVFDGGLTIVHLIGLLLAGGIGLDFSLFGLTLSADADRRARTNFSISLCALSTGGVFLILGQSSIGLLHMLGTTVAIGILLSLIFTGFSQARCPPPTT